MRPREARPMIVAQARLSFFLTLLVPLFVALQAVVEDGGPRIEIRSVPRDVTIEVPVDVVVERIVDRLVFVPVPTVTLHPWARSLWDLSTWDVTRLPEAGSLPASAGVLRPSPVGGSVFAPSNAAVTAGIIGAGAPIARFGQVAGGQLGANGFAPNAQLTQTGASTGQLDLSSVLSGPLLPLTVTSPDASSSSTSAPPIAVAEAIAPSDGAPDDAAVSAAPSAIEPAGPVPSESPPAEQIAGVPETVAGGPAVTGGPAATGSPPAPVITLPRQPIREQRPETGTGSQRQNRISTAPVASAPGGSNGTNAPPGPAPDPAPALALAQPAPTPAPPPPAPAQPAPATPTPVPASRAPAGPTPETPNAQPVPTKAPTKAPPEKSSPTEKSAATQKSAPTEKSAPKKTPTPQPTPTKAPPAKSAPAKTATPQPARTKAPAKPAPTRTPTPKQKSESPDQGKNHGQNQGKHQSNNHGQNRQK
jgi:hypothetical protein